MNDIFGGNGFAFRVPATPVPVVQAFTHLLETLCTTQMRDHPEIYLESVRPLLDLTDRSSPEASAAFRRAMGAFTDRLVAERIEVAAHVQALLDLLFSKDQSPEALYAAGKALLADVRDHDEASGRLRFAIGHFLNRFQEYERVTRLRLAKEVQTTIGARNNHDKGSAEAIQWFDPLPPEKADALLVLDAKTGAALRQLLQSIRLAPVCLAQGIRPPTRIQMLGPPGVGKTTAARWLASQLGIPLAVVIVDQLISTYIGKGGRNLRAVAKKAAKRGAMLFLDEIDAVGARRDSDGGHDGALEGRRLTTTLLQMLNPAAPQLPQTMVVAIATNLPWLLDPALLRRLPKKIVFDFPDAEARREMATRTWGKLAATPAPDAFNRLVARTEGRSGAYVVDVAHEAALLAVIDADASGGAAATVTELHVNRALAAVPVPEELRDPRARASH